MPASTHVGLAVCPASTISVFLFGLGGALVATPSPVIRTFLPCLDEDDGFVELSELETTLSRLTGAIFLSLALFFLLIPTLSCIFGTQGNNGTFALSSTNKGQCRAALASQALLGLLVVIVGLIEDATSENSGGSSGAKRSSCGNMKVTSLLSGGAIITVLACAGMMASFWPQTDDDDAESEIASPRSSRLQRVIGEIEENNLGTPLLSTNENGEGGDLESQPRSAGAAENEILEEEEERSSESLSAEHQHDFASSRITGKRRLMKLAAPQMFYLYVGCTVLLIRLPFSLSIPHFVSTTLGALSRQDYAGAKVEILLLFIMGSIDAALDFWCVFLFGYAKERIVKGVRLDTFAAILRQECAFFDANTSGDLSSRLTSDCGEMAGDLTWFFRFSIESIVRITGVVTYMMIRSPLLGSCAISIVPLVGVVNKKYGDWLGKNAKAVQTALAEANSTAQEAFSCLRTVISFASEGKEHDKYQTKIEKYYRLNIRQLYMTGFYYMLISTFLINTCVQAALLFVGALLIQHGRLTAEVLLAFMLYQGQLQNETQNLFNSYTSLIKSSGAGDKVFALLDRRPPPPGTGSADVLSGSVDDDDDDNNGAAIKGIVGSVQLNEVGFAYPSRADHPVLRDMSLHIRPGSTMALVGPSGSGKTTVISLLERFYDPVKGSVLIDGKDLRSMDIKTHRRHIGIVTQDPVLFSGTILSNISYGCPTATFDEVVRAAKLANAHDFITSFPAGYDTPVGERGAQLSGGQRQRVVIARAIIKQPRILLLDEATSALDSESERVVQEALDHLLSNNTNMTTIVIAHRLQTVRNADSIAVINDGRVVEEGSHKDLVQRKGGLYRAMVDKSDGIRMGLLNENM